MRHDYLDEHQNIAVDALCELKRVCDKHGIKFYLLAGTTLGAVRHGGMIPWDDDIDVGFLPEELDKLKAVLADELDPRFEYASCENEYHFPRMFGKILCERRCCVDLFLIAHWTSNNLRGYWRWQVNRFSIEGYYHSIHYKKAKKPTEATPEEQAATARTVSAAEEAPPSPAPVPLLKKIKNRLRRIVKKTMKFLRRMVYCAMPFMKPEQYIALARKNERFFETHGGDCYINLYSVYGMKKERLLSKWVENPSTVEFEGESYQTMGYLDEYLTHLYGNYMQLPPANKRVRSLHGEVYPKQEE